MATKREKKVVIKNVSPQQADEAMGKYAVADAQIEKTTATMDLEIAAIREKHSEKLDKLTSERDDQFDIIHKYYEEHPEAFGEKKSLEVTHGRVGFRTGTPKLKLIKGFTWASVTNLLKSFLPDYVRTVDEPSKEKLLADRNDAAVNKKFEKCGITVDQDETFFIELKKEEAAVA